MKRYLFLLLTFLGISTATSQTKPWMSRIDDETSLARINIPGTHDTCALYGFLSWGQCQTLTLIEQLDHGVRFLDIRCKLIESELKIYHGIIDQKATFIEVINQCATYLKKNPSEVIVMSIMDEGSPEIQPGQFGAAISKAMKTKPKLWHLTKTPPILGDVRGKIVVVSRNREVKGIGWSSLKIQDAFRLSGDTAIEDKKQKIEAHSKKAAASKTGWYVNFTSGTSARYPPGTASKAINPWLLKRFKQPAVGYQGIMVMDFVTIDLIKAIAESNSQ